MSHEIREKHMAGAPYQRKETVLLVMHFHQCVSINCHSQCSHRLAAALIILLIVVKTAYVFLFGKENRCENISFSDTLVILFIYHIIRVGEQLSAEAEASWSAC